MNSRAISRVDIGFYVRTNIMGPEAVERRPVWSESRRPESLGSERFWDILYFARFCWFV